MKQPGRKLATFQTNAHCVRRMLCNYCVNTFWRRAAFAAPDCGSGIVYYTNRGVLERYIEPDVLLFLLHVGGSGLSGRSIDAISARLLRLPDVPTCPLAERRA